MLILKQIRGNMPDFDPIMRAALPDPATPRAALPPARKNQQQQKALSALKSESESEESLTFAINARCRSVGLLARRHGDIFRRAAEGKEEKHDKEKERGAGRVKLARMHREQPAQKQQQQETQRIEKKQRQQLREKLQKSEHQNRERRRVSEREEKTIEAPEETREGKAAAVAGKAKAKEAGAEKAELIPVVIPALGRPHRVVVVGAGFAGIAASLELQKLGVEVIVLEVRPCVCIFGWRGRSRRACFLVAWYLILD